MEEKHNIHAVYSERGKLHLLYQNFKFRAYRFMKTTEEQCWRCVSRNCTTKLFTRGDGTTFSRIEGNHNHGAMSERDLNRKSVSNAVKRKAIDDFDERPTKLIHKEVEQQHRAVKTLTRKDMKYIRNNIIHTRLKNCLNYQNHHVKKFIWDDEKFQARMSRTPLDDEEMSAREAAIIRKEKQLSALHEEIKLQQRALEEAEEKVLADQLKNDETERQLKREGAELRFKEKALERDQGKLKEQHESQLQHIKELQENMMKEQAKIVEERLQLAGERARLDALAKLRGVNSASSYDMLQARAEVHGALEAARELELELNEERQKLKHQQRILEVEKSRLQEIESDLSVRAQHMDSLVQVAEAKKLDGQKALEQARLIQKRATETMREAEMKMTEVKEREQNLIKEQMDITKEHVVLSKRREQLDQILPELSSAESLYLQPVSKAVIDPKLLIMKLKAEKELSSHS